MATEWNKLVKKTYDLGKMSNPAYTLGDAMKNAKKVYKNTSTIVSNITKGRVPKGRKSRRGGKKRRSSKKH
jgi:hypothetical protein